MFKHKMKDNTPFSIIGIKTRQKINYDIEYLKNTINQFDIDRTTQQTTEQTFF